MVDLKLAIAALMIWTGVVFILAGLWYWAIRISGWVQRRMAQRTNRK